MPLKMLQVCPEYYEAVKAIVEEHDTPERREAYLNGDFPRADAVKDLDMRYRWDLYWVAFDKLRGTDLRDWQDRSINDNHVDSALRSIVAPLRQTVAA